MKNRIILIMVMSLVSISLFSRNGNDMVLNSSYIIPVKNSNFNSSLVLGFGAEFWGIFELVGNAYLEIDDSEPKFFDKFQSPNVFSFGVGANIPLGGFYFLTDYQRFFAFEKNRNELSVSAFTDSYKLGIGINLDDNVILEAYSRTIFDINTEFDDSRQSFIGIGLKIYL